MSEPGSLTTGCWLYPRIHPLWAAAGFDAARGDPLGDCDLTPQGYAHLTEGLVALGAPVCLALEGGYNVPSVKYSLGACVAQLLQGDPESCGDFSARDSETEKPARPQTYACLNETIVAQRPFWPGLAPVGVANDASPLLATRPLRDATVTG